MMQTPNIQLDTEIIIMYVYIVSEQKLFLVQIKLIINVYSYYYALGHYLPIIFQDIILTPTTHIQTLQIKPIVHKRIKVADQNLLKK